VGLSVDRSSENPPFQSEFLALVSRKRIKVRVIRQGTALIAVFSRDGRGRAVAKNISNPRIALEVT
jgi:hypothetical protein